MNKSLNLFTCYTSLLHPHGILSNCICTTSTTKDLKENEGKDNKYYKSMTLISLVLLFDPMPNGRRW